LKFYTVSLYSNGNGESDKRSKQQFSCQETLWAGRARWVSKLGSDLLIDALGRARNSATTLKWSCLTEACWLVPC